MQINYKVKNNDTNTINQVLKNELNVSTRLLSKLIKGKKVLLNGTVTDTRNVVAINDNITIVLDEEETCDNIVATPMDLDIVYEDERNVNFK